MKPSSRTNSGSIFLTYVPFSNLVDEAIQSDPSEKDEKYLETLHNLLSLQNRVREIEDANTCAICLEKPRNMAFLCGHGTCVECAEALEVCPMCRKPIVQKIKLFT